MPLRKAPELDYRPAERAQTSQWRFWLKVLVLGVVGFFLVFGILIPALLWGNDSAFGRGSMTVPFPSIPLLRRPTSTSITVHRAAFLSIFTASPFREHFPPY